MKKLMVAVALTACATGAFADCKDPGSGQTKTPDAAVYAWQFKGKTGTGVIVKTKDTPSSSTCSDNGVPGGTEVIRVPGSLAIQAYTYICEDECMTFEANLQNPTKQQYFATKPFKSAIDLYKNIKFVTAIDAAHIIGKNHNQYELAGKAQFVFGGDDPTETFDVTFAGFGSYDSKNGRVSSVSGNFAGTQNFPCYPGKVAGITASCPPADYWTCAPYAYAGDARADSVAYGTWSLKYNASASKKLAANKNYWVK